MTDHDVPYTLEFPEYLDGYEMETEAKGYLIGVKVSTADETFQLTVYDAERLAQDVKSEVPLYGLVAYRCLLVVPDVTREQIARAVATLAKSGFADLKPDPRFI
jgi:hypothetical protein